MRDVPAGQTKNSHFEDVFDLPGVPVQTSVQALTQNWCFKKLPQDEHYVFTIIPKIPTTVYRVFQGEVAIFPKWYNKWLMPNKKVEIKTYPKLLLFRDLGDLLGMWLIRDSYSKFYSIRKSNFWACGHILSSYEHSVLEHRKIYINIRTLL